MKNTRHIIFIALACCHKPYILPISIVYNFRIAQITKQSIFEPNDKEHQLVGLIFDQYRKKYNGTFQNFVGGLGSYIYDYNSYYFRVDGAVSHIKETVEEVTTFSGTETDDILFTFGKNRQVDERNSVTLSGLFGVPTHRIYRLHHVDFGYSQVGLGIQLDGSYKLNMIDSFLYGIRYIYFVPRNALDPQESRHKFTIGNIADLLLAYKKNWSTHGFECGYTLRSRFGSHAHPPYDDIMKKTDYVRSNFYGALKYKFKTEDTAQRLILYLSYGFDHTPKIYGNKYIVTIWGSWSISF